jgi:hypothetical protein
MDASRNDLLGEIASDAALERTDFLVQATEQLRKFLDANGKRIQGLGGLTLIDEDPDFLSIAPDLTFRSRSRYLDEDTNEWVSETEIIESAAELVELYNPADVFQAFADAARTASGLPEEPTAADDLMDVAGIAPDEAVFDGEDPYAGAADRWAAADRDGAEPADEEEAAGMLYDLALQYQERSQATEAELIEQFEAEAGRLTKKIGDLIIVDDDDERLTLQRSGSFHAEVVAEDADGEWKTLRTPEEIVEFYDPTDVFGDLAESLAEAYPSVTGEEADEGAAPAAETDGQPSGLPAYPDDGEDEPKGPPTRE